MRGSKGRWRAQASGRRFATGVAVAALLLFSGACGEGDKGGRSGGAHTTPLAPKAADPARPLAYVRSGVVVVRDGAAGADRTLFRPERGEARTVAWAADSSALFASVGLEVWRVPLDGSAAARVAEIHDEANDRIGVLAASAAGATLVAETVGPEGVGMYDNARYFEVDVATGRATELSARSFETLSGRLRRFTSRESEPLVSPSGRWALRVAPFGSDVGASTEQLTVSANPAGEPRTLATAASLPPDPSGAQYTGIFNDARWAPDRDTVLFVAQNVCGDFCYGPLFAVEADGSNLRRIGASLDVVPDEWNGPQLAFEDFPSDRRAVVVVDVATGERFEVGEGRSPAWKPGAGK